MEPKFFDIFSNKKTKQIEKPKILVDYREKNSLVISELISLGAEPEIKELKTGDYITKGTIVERKTISDFLTSMTNKRLLNQIENLKEYKDRLLIIEGIETEELYKENSPGINPNAIRGFLLSISLKHKIPILFSKSPHDTAQYLMVLARKKHKDISLKNNRKAFNKAEQVQFILEGFPGIGPKTAKKLLKELGSLKNIFQAKNSDLEKVIGKKAVVFKLLDEKL